MMFKVMKAVYDSRLPMSFKGSMVLKAALLEAGYRDNVRHTVDIDGSWFSETPPKVEFIGALIQKAVDGANLPYKITATRDYGDGRSAGFKFESKQTGSSDFTMDMEINKPPRETKLYEINGCIFSGVVVSSILADKILVISTRKVFRRMKDLYDIYYLSKVVALDKTKVMSVLVSENKTLGDFYEFLHMKEELEHAYEKFVILEETSKIPFEEVYVCVLTYINSFMPKP